MKKLIPNSFKFKIVVAFSLVLIVTLTTFSFWVVTDTREWFYNNVDESLKSSVKSIDDFLYMRKFVLNDTVARITDSSLIEKSVGNALISNANEALEMFNLIYESMSLNPQRYYIQIYNNQKQLVWKSRNLTNSRLPVFLSEKDVVDLKTYADAIYTYDTLPTYVYRKHLIGKPGDTIFINVPYHKSAMRIYIAKTQNYMISIGYSLSTINYILHNFSQYFYYGMPFIALILISLLFFLSKVAYKPIDKITEALEQVNPKSLDLHLPYKLGDEEYGKLSHALENVFNKTKSAFGKSQQFASDASHELKTPLTILRGELELALNNNKTHDQYQEIIASSLDEVIRLTNVVDTLLELSRADRGKIAMNFRRVNLTELIVDIKEDIEILAENKKIAIKSELQADVWITIDPQRIHQVLLNIFDNAVKYTPDNGFIEIFLTKSTNGVTIKIKDSGIGIAQEQLELIFDKFFRATQATNSNICGSGLGLSIAKWVVDAHNGTINVESEVGKGTVFTIYLPEKENE